MSEEEILKLKDGNECVFEVMVGGKYGRYVGRVLFSQVKEAAKFVREKWGCEPQFYLECCFGHLSDPEGNHYKFAENT